MKVIAPVPFNISQLLSTNAVDSYADWSAATTYSKGTRVHYLDKYWESLTNSNLNKIPSTNPTEWLEVGPCNIVAMFDNSISTSTVSPSPLTVSVKPGKSINSIALLGLVGTSVEIEVLDNIAGSVIYSKTVSLDGSIITDWYDYFFGEFDIRNTVVVTDIPPYVNCVINITLDGDADVSVGTMVYGNASYIGDIQYGVNFGIRDYSIKEADVFGNTVFVERAYSRRMEPNVMIENTKLPFVTKLLDNIRATPTVWVGSEDVNYSPLVVFGYYKDYSISINYPANSLISLQIEGLA